MGGETSIQLCQWRGREFPNEESITGLEFFQLTTKMNDLELKNMIRRDYGYCICRQIIYKKEGHLIQNKYFPERNSGKMNWIYIGILKDTNCRCAFYEIQKINEALTKEIKLLHEENKELKKLVEKGNSEIIKLKNSESNLEKKINEIKSELNQIKTQNNTNVNNANNNANANQN
jgi:predicted DNA-binding ArsR family transcriptional regulator